MVLGGLMSFYSIKHRKYLLCSIIAVCCISAHAKNNLVSFECPSLQEARSSDLKSSRKDKSVTWSIISKSLYPNATPSGFKGVVLEQKDDSSFDLSVKCIYKTEQNQKYVIEPNASFMWYVDAVSENPIGNNWSTNDKKLYWCTKSISDCKFSLR